MLDSGLFNERLLTSNLAFNDWAILVIQLIIKLHTQQDCWIGGQPQWGLPDEFINAPTESSLCYGSSMNYIKILSHWLPAVA